MRKQSEIGGNSDLEFATMPARSRRRSDSKHFPVVPFMESQLPNKIGSKKKGRRARRDSHGFTLIEVLVVIGIIAILAAVVLVAVNPARQFKLARDSQRVSNVNSILNAIHQNMSEHKGSFVCSGVTKALPTTSTDVRSDASASYSGDIAACLVPDYISALPVDPSIVGAHYASPADYDTKYEISQDANGRITASSTGELTATIFVTR